MAQKSDTFGKDSEASVALGQGKPVIVYVPKLHFSVANLDSEQLHSESDSRLKQIILASREFDEDLDDTLDHDGLYAEALSIELSKLTDEQLAQIVKIHWADFGLLDESDRIRGKDDTSRREQYTKWITNVISKEAKTSVPKAVRQDLLRIITALTINYEQRAHLFREIHPLALQVILSSGVLNGILVSRSVNSCAKLLRGLIENKLALELKVDAGNYRLVETTTKSTIRVISRNNLLVNAFEAYYHRL